MGLYAPLQEHRNFYYCKNFSFSYPFMVNQEKKKRILKVFFYILWWLKKKDAFLEVIGLRFMATQ